MTLQAKLADVESWDGSVLVVASPRAFAPGAPLTIALVVSEAAPPLTLDAKSIGSKKREGEGFTVRLRLVNLRRETRAQLDALFPR